MSQLQHPSGTKTRKRGSRRKLHIPVEFETLLSHFTRDPHEKLELWWYAMARLMLERSQVVLAGQHEVAGRMWLTLRLMDDNEFDVVLPELTPEREQELLESVRDVIAKQRRIHASENAAP